jgi:hypothetical protein
VSFTMLSVSQTVLELLKKITMSRSRSMSVSGGYELYNFNVSVSMAIVLHNRQPISCETKFWFLFTSSALKERSC